MNNMKKIIYHKPFLEKILTKEFLIQEYIKNKKSSTKIAKEQDVNIKTIFTYLKKHNIKIRSRSENGKILYSNPHNNPNYIDGRSTKKYYCIICKVNEISYVAWKYYKRRCHSCAGKTVWNNKEFRNKMIKSFLKSRLIKPNKPETLLGNMLNVLFPKEYKFVGDGKVIISGFNPDFINCNGQKKVIELFGDYWHRNTQKKDNRRLKEYKELGYETLIIWEHELKDIDKLTNRLMEFNNK
jgi:very-short-patch-repair endonuclease